MSTTQSWPAVSSQPREAFPLFLFSNRHSGEEVQRNRPPTGYKMHLIDNVRLVHRTVPRLEWNGITIDVERNITGRKRSKGFRRTGYASGIQEDQCQKIPVYTGCWVTVRPDVESSQCVYSGFRVLVLCCVQGSHAVKLQGHVKCPQSKYLALTHYH